MSAFAEIFDATTRFLKQKGSTPEVVLNKKATPKDLVSFEKQTGITLPDSFTAFFTEYSDGIEYRWENGEDELGGLSIPGLSAIAEKRIEWSQYVHDFLDDPKSMNGCVNAPYRKAAFQIWHRMLSWVPFYSEPNGDHFCVDINTCRIVYDQHDWFDGFGSIAKTNGIPAGENLTEFLRNWSQFCFSPDSEFWWGRFAECGEIKWEPKFFHPQCCRGKMSKSKR